MHAPEDDACACSCWICILIQMRTTLNLDDALLREAARLTGISGKTALVHAALEALIARESARRLAALGGAEPGLRQVPRVAIKGAPASLWDSLKSERPSRLGLCYLD